MPIYEYRCSSCGHELEALQKLAEAPLVTCPTCHANALVKLMSASAFQLKGSGWYATDFKSSGTKPVEKPSSESAGEGKSADASASASKSEAKPDTNSETKTASTPAASAPSATPAAGSSSGSGGGST